MPVKPKFKPLVMRIKLNPEQAVLSCDCWTVGRAYDGLNTNDYYSDNLNPISQPICYKASVGKGGTFPHNACNSRKDQNPGSPFPNGYSAPWSSTTAGS